MEIENYEDDMSSYCFVTLQGKINEVDDEGVKLTVRKIL